MSLYSLKNNSIALIEKMPIVPLLTSMGVREGIKISVVTKQPMGGPIVVQIGRRSIAIGKDVAEQILIKEAI